MAKKEAAAATAATGTEATAGAAASATEAAGNQGVAVTLPNGERRIDYIRNNYYSDVAPFAHIKDDPSGKCKSRSAIKNAINEMLKAAGQGDKVIPYQIVFSATKEGNDPRKKPAAAAPAATVTA